MSRMTTTKCDRALELLSRGLRDSATTLEAEVRGGIRTRLLSQGNCVRVISRGIRFENDASKTLGKYED